MFISSALQGKPGIDGKRGLPGKDVRSITLTALCCVIPAVLVLCLMAALFCKCTCFECIFSFHREKEDQKEMMAKRFLKFNDTSLNIHQAVACATLHVTVRVQWMLYIQFQGEKGDQGANVSSLEN